MSERMSNCAIVDNAKTLASQKGLDASRVFCPLIHICDGSSCCFNGGNKSELKTFEQINQIDRFYTTLEKSLNKK